MLETGEIDAFISAIVPRAYLNGSPHNAQLFPAVEASSNDQNLWMVLGLVT